MKHLVGRLEFEVLYGPMIQSVFEHNQLLIGDGLHAPLVGNVLVQQTNEVLVAATLCTAKLIGLVGLGAKGLIDGLVIPKHLAFDLSKSLHP